MKRTFALMLAIVMMVMLTACGGTLNEDIQAIGDVNSGNSAGEQQQPAVSINEMILVDEAGVKITAKSIDEGGLFGPEIKLLIENNSGKDLTFQCGYAAVNGYMVGTIMSVDVVNGKKANDSLTFQESDLEMCGIKALADIELTFHIFDTEEWESYLDTDAIPIKTSIADTYEYSFDDSGDPAYEGNGLKIVVKGLVEDESILGPGVVVYIENTSQTDVTVQTRDVSINGYMVDALFSCDVIAGKRAVDTITFMESELEENEIVGIKDVELSFHVFDSEDWETIVDTETVTIQFNEE